MVITNVIVANHELEMNSGMVFAVPIPSKSAADAKSIQNAIDTAISEARYVKFRLVNAIC